MLKGSLCANPELSAYVTLFPFGLSNKNDTCFVIAGDGNLGDGFTMCGVQTEKQALATFDKGYLVRGRMLVHRLDDMVQEPVHLMKMDVEGWEYNILQGASRLLLHHHVWYIIAEASRGIIGEDGAYRLLSLLVAHGYSVSNTGFRGPWIQQADTDKRSVPNEQ